MILKLPINKTTYIRNDFTEERGNLLFIREKLRIADLIGNLIGDKIAKSFRYKALWYRLPLSFMLKKEANGPGYTRATGRAKFSSEESAPNTTEING